MDNLRYTDESDRGYGAAGMAISIVINDGEEMLASVSLEGPASETVVMSPEFYFAGNPGVSAKSAWNQILKNYNIGVSMMMANVMCRYLVNLHKQIPPEVKKTIHDLAQTEGTDSCQLEADEVDRLFNTNYAYLTRVFSHSGVQSVAHDFVAALKQRRTLSRLDALDLLSALRML